MFTTLYGPLAPGKLSAYDLSSPGGARSGNSWLFAVCSADCARDRIGFVQGILLPTVGTFSIGPGKVKLGSPARQEVPTFQLQDGRFAAVSQDTPKSLRVHLLHLYTPAS